MITAPGIYPGVHRISMDAYVLDPCEAPSLTASGLNDMQTRSPLYFFSRHPRLAPDAWKRRLTKSATRGMELGSVLHDMVLGGEFGAGWKMINPRDFLTKKGEPCKDFRRTEAKAARDEAEAQGFIVISPAEEESLTEARDVCIENLTREYGDWPPGESELTYIWKRGEVWCRARPDHTALRHLTVFNLKTTALELNDHAVDAMALKDGWPFAEAWHLEGVEAHHTDARKRLRYRFPVQQIVPPYDFRMVDLDRLWVERAAQRIDRHVETFAGMLRELESSVTARPRGYGASYVAQQPQYDAVAYEMEEMTEGEDVLR